MQTMIKIEFQSRLTFPFYNKVYTLLFTHSMHLFYFNISNTYKKAVSSIKT